MNVIGVWRWRRKRNHGDGAVSLRCIGRRVPRGRRFAAGWASWTTIRKRGQTVAFGRPVVAARKPRPPTRGDPESPLRWTTKSTRHLAGELRARGHAVSHSAVANLLRSIGYSLQSPRKTLEGAQHPDRDAQFRYLNSLAAQFLAAGEPVISVDTKKKELVGRFGQAGREWQPSGNTTNFRLSGGG